MHLLHIFEHGKEFLNVAAQFIRAGLDAGEYCLWITTPPWFTSLALHELALYYVPEIDRYVQAGQLAFVEHEAWYVQEAGTLDVERIVANAVARIDHAYAQGWRRVRVCGQPCNPGMNTDWPSLLEYESHLQQQVKSMEWLLLCAYRTGTIRGSIKDALRDTHDGVLEPGEGAAWKYTPKG